MSTLRYKLERQGKYLILVDRWFPSSKLCSKCGWKNPALTISTRFWKCKKCGELLDRDINASQNLFHEGIKKIKALGITINSTVGTTGSHAREDDVRHPLDAVVDEPRIHRL